METKIKRKYNKEKDTKEFKIYNDFVDRFLIESNILNSGTEKINAYSTLWDKPAIESAIRELEGEHDGLYRANDFKDPIPAQITHANDKLWEVNDQFKEYCERKEKQGYNTPTEWPEGMLKERLRWEAHLTVYLRELEFLKAELAKREDAEEEVKVNNDMLAFGTLGVGQIFNNDLVLIDGQKVERIGKDNILVITEPTSIYYGMRISDYRVMSEKWCAERHAKRKELQKKFNQEYAQTGHSNIKVPDGLGIKKVSKTNLPKWPSNVPNYLTKEKEAK
jgi:hypothetical protein